MVTGPEGRKLAATRAASASVGNGSASFAGPHVTVGNLRVSQTEYLRYKACISLRNSTTFSPTTTQGAIVFPVVKRGRARAVCYP
jgi:hypothetical protein